MAVIKRRTGPGLWRGAKSEENCALEWKKFLGVKSMVKIKPNNNMMKSKIKCERR